MSPPNAESNQLRPPRNGHTYHLTADDASTSQGSTPSVAAFFQSMLSDDSQKFQLDVVFREWDAKTRSYSDPLVSAPEGLSWLTRPTRGRALAPVSTAEQLRGADKDPFTLYDLHVLAQRSLTRAVLDGCRGALSRHRETLDKLCTDRRLPQFSAEERTQLRADLMRFQRESENNATLLRDLAEEMGHLRQHMERSAETIKKQSAAHLQTSDRVEDDLPLHNYLVSSIDLKVSAVKMLHAHLSEHVEQSSNTARDPFRPRSNDPSSKLLGMEGKLLAVVTRQLDTLQTMNREHHLQALAHCGSPADLASMMTRYRIRVLNHAQSDPLEAQTAHIGEGHPDLAEGQISLGQNLNDTYLRVTFLPEGLGLADYDHRPCHVEGLPTLLPIGLLTQDEFNEYHLTSMLDLIAKRTSRDGDVRTQFRQHWLPAATAGDGPVSTPAEAIASLSFGHVAKEGFGHGQAFLQAAIDLAESRREANVKCASILQLKTADKTLESADSVNKWLDDIGEALEAYETYETYTQMLKKEAKRYIDDFQAARDARLADWSAMTEKNGDALQRDKMLALGRASLAVSLQGTLGDLTSAIAICDGKSEVDVLRILDTAQLVATRQQDRATQLTKELVPNDQKASTFFETWVTSSEKSETPVRDSISGRSTKSKEPRATKKRPAALSNAKSADEIAKREEEHQARGALARYGSLYTNSVTGKKRDIQITRAEIVEDVKDERNNVVSAWDAVLGRFISQSDLPEVEQTAWYYYPAAETSSKEMTNNSNPKSRDLVIGSATEYSRKRDPEMSGHVTNDHATEDKSVTEDASQAQLAQSVDTSRSRQRHLAFRSVISGDTFTDGHVPQVGPLGEKDEESASRTIAALKGLLHNETGWDAFWATRPMPEDSAGD